MAITKDLAFAPIRTLGKKLRAGEFTSLELTKFFLHRLDNIRTVDSDEPFKHVPSIFLRGLSNLQLEFDVRQRDRYFPNASVY